MQPGTENNNSTGNWRDAFAQAEALEALPQDAQREALERLTLADPQLAQRVALMLGGGDTHASVDVAVTKVLGNTRVKSENAFKANDAIGAYTLVRPLGKGGMADVWLAQRTDGALKRPVALKLPVALLPSPLLAERFARERDMLAQLDHPNIARIYDAGTTAHGQPFLALEFIDGEALDHWCRETQASMRTRVALIMQVAQAVHHAHSRLVLHRDLKPSNILVTRDGVVKVLDFGIAKLLTEERTAEETQFTRMTGAALTPKYAAPEQLLSETVTTSTDVYALAVVLYELLAGCVPFEAQAKDLSARMATLDHPCRLLSEHAISAPQVLALSAVSARNVRRALAGDLSAILDKALRRATNDRYPSALAFADDLQRYLGNRPVLARHGAIAYRVRKFFARNRLPVAIAAMGALAAIGLGHHAFTQSQRAQQSQQRADSIDGLMESLFQGMSPDIAAKRTFTAKELLDRASAHHQRNASLEHESGAASTRLASLYRDIGEYRSAIALHKKALLLARERKDRRAEAFALWSLADNHTRIEELDEAGSWIEAAKAASAHVVKPDELLARIALAQGQKAWLERRYDEADDAYADAEAQIRQIDRNNAELLAWAVEGRGMAARSRGDLAAARGFFENVQTIDAENPARGEIDRLRSQSHLAALDYSEGRYKAALIALQSVCSAFIGRLGHDHQETSVSCQRYAYCAMRVGQPDAAKAVLSALRAGTPATETDQQQAIAQLMGVWEMYYGDAAAAAPALQEIIARNRARNLANTDSAYRIERQLAESMLRQGRTEPAAQLLEATLKGQTALRGREHADVAMTQTLLAMAHLRHGRRTEADLLLQQSVAILTKTRGGAHPFTIAATAYARLASGAVADPPYLAKFDAELGWQRGATTLKQLISSAPDRPIDWKSIPVVF